MKLEMGVIDKNMELEIKARLCRYTFLNVSDLRIWVSSGIAYLGGFVSDFKHKKLAGEITSNIDGVRAVVNMLRVTPIVLQPGAKSDNNKLFTAR